MATRALKPGPSPFAVAETAPLDPAKFQHPDVTAKGERRAAVPLQRQEAQAGGHDAVRWCTLEEARTRLLGAHPGFATLLEQALRPRHAASIDPNPHIHTGTPR